MSVSSPCSSPLWSFESSSYQPSTIVSSDSISVYNEEVVYDNRSDIGTATTTCFEERAKKRCKTVNQPRKTQNPPPPDFYPNGAGTWEETKVIIEINNRRTESTGWAFRPDALTVDDPVVADSDIEKDDEACQHLKNALIDPPLCAVSCTPWELRDRSPSPPPPTHIHYTDQMNPPYMVEEKRVVIPKETFSQRPPIDIILCPVQGCSKTFETRSALRKHRIVHVDTRLQCTQCDKKFKEKTKLRRHELVHSGEKKYKCLVDGCGKEFALSFNLTAHRKTHFPNESSLIGCPFPGCQSKFTKKSNMKAHLKRHNKKVIKNT